MLHGKPQTGKSTVIQIAEKMVSPENLCSVEPHQFHGFNMESMVGKLVNSDTDITTDAPISEANVKKIIDRRMFRIRRKGIADAYGFLPGVHVFGGNGIPPTLDGAHRAHDRRWTFISFNHVQGVGKYDIEYWLWVWEQSPQGIINFAIAGLEDLLKERGHYLNPESGKKKMDEWQTNTDPVELFIRDARAGVLELPPERDKNGNIVDSKTQVKVGETYRVKQPLLWGAFVAWHLDTFQQKPKVSRFGLYAALREKGYPTVIIGGYDHFSGIGNIEVPHSHF
jgi:phage/plasmid-associated DNA primase